MEEWEPCGTCAVHQVLFGGRHILCFAGIPDNNLHFPACRDNHGCSELQADLWRSLPVHIWSELWWWWNMWQRSECYCGLSGAWLTLCWQPGIQHVLCALPWCQLVQQPTWVNTNEHPCNRRSERTFCTLWHHWSISKSWKVLVVCVFSGFEIVHIDLRQHCRWCWIFLDVKIIMVYLIQTFAALQAELQLKYTL